MLYVPPPYSSGTNLSVCEQGKYTITTPPSPPTALLSSDLHSHNEATDCQPYLLTDTKDSIQESPPLTPKQAAELQDPGPSQTTTGVVDSFYSDGDYVFYNNHNGFEDTTDDEDHPQQGGYVYEPFYSTPMMTNDYFETANRAFHATINKFSRQNYPEHRKRNMYNFLENWHLHNIYSKSQQVLLGIPHVRPMVLLSGDDFMFTPPLLQQQQQSDEDDDEYEDGGGYMEDYVDDHYQQQLGYLDQSMQMEWIDDDGQMFEDNGGISDDGVVIMSAPDPPLMAPPPISSVLNENVWMKNHMNLISESFILNDDNQQQQQQQEKEDASFSTGDQSPHFLGAITSELLHWYRTSDRGRPPSTIMENYGNDEEEGHTVTPIMLTNDYDNNQNTSDDDLDTNNKKMNTRPTHADDSIKLIPKHDSFTPISYQSLADIVNHSSTSHDLLPPDYGSTAYTGQQELKKHQRQKKGLKHQMMAASNLALAMASNYRSEGNATPSSFIRCVFRIWHVFMLTAETVLVGLWGQPPQSASLSTNTKSNIRSSSVQSILPF
ncbi:hypothetical protein BC941DRAFT_445327 [Chlamydoabsidia padenii]|nr:hypothetical protein BC941DRAFT_445327 [Chlamydoabsidia padenii]